MTHRAHGAAIHLTSQSKGPTRVLISWIRDAEINISNCVFNNFAKGESESESEILY